jgi:carboxyl-terminal processing protease
MTPRILLLVALLCSGLLSACGGGGGGGSDASSSAATSQAPASCSVADQRLWLRSYMNDQYFFYANQGTPDEAATSMDAYFQSLLYKPTDRYSFTQPTAQFTQFFSEGQSTGYGYSLAFSDAAQTVFKVRYVEPASPVAAAGLLRGETVQLIDGYTAAQVAAGALPAVTTAGVPRNFTVVNASGVTRTFTVNSADYALTPVPINTVFSVPAAGGGTAKVGYLLYQQFISGSSAALGTAMNNFRTAGITELIVDMRYNGGGSTTVARNLASMIGGSALDGQAFAQFRFNDKQAANNFTFAFTNAGLPAAPLDGLPRLIFITSPSTASASEILINSLKPFRKVVQVGGTTFGKPYAFQPRDACGTTYNAVNLDTVNAAGVGGFTSGLVPTCVVPDDLTHALGDPAEGRLAEALGYVRTGACPTGSVPTAGLLAMPAALRAVPETAFGEVGHQAAYVD